MRKNRKEGVCYFGTYRDYYCRNKINIRLLKKAGVKVYTCHIPFMAKKHGTEKPFRILGIIQNFIKLLFIYVILSIKYLFFTPAHELVFVGYIGHQDVFLAKILTFLTGRRLVFDLFVSLYDTLVLDRGLVSLDSPVAKMIYLADKISITLADTVLIDTEEHRDYLKKTFNIKNRKIEVVPLGIEEEIFSYKLCKKQTQKKFFTLVQYSYFAPLHGTEYVISAAKLLNDYPDIKFHLIGDGQLKKRVMQMIKENGLKNIRISGIVTPQILAQYIMEADICLGIFGKSEKVSRVIPNKVLHGLAMKRCVITSFSSALERYYQHGKHLFLCQRADPESLKDAILTLKQKSDLRSSLVENGYSRFLHCHNEAVVSRRLYNSLNLYLK
ncbi:MAG: glycosyltransferase family 4 protein [Fibrobacter sp.]|nr:glycosyltransferase family 4 protein [Fibrobacter sp.]